MLTSEVPFLPFYFFTFLLFYFFTFLPFYLFTLLPLKKSLLFEGFDEPNTHRLAILLGIADVGENLS